MRKILIPVVFVMIGIFFASVYVVEEGTRGVVLRFNKIIGLSTPGLHFKIPGVDSVKIIDAKIQTIDSANSGGEKKFITRGKEVLIIDYFAQWKIIDFNRYYETVAGGNSIENLLLARLSGRLRAEVGRLSIGDIINDSNEDTRSRKSMMIQVKDELNGVDASSNENIPVKELLANVEKDPDSKTSMRAFGIEVIDVRIKQINLPPEVSGSIYAKMNTEREVVARNQRFQGVSNAEKIRADATLEATKILSEAERQSRIIKGEGDANAAKLYADAFSKDKEFFSFIRSLKAYEQSFTGNDVMVISPDSEFFRYMKLTKN